MIERQQIGKTEVYDGRKLRACLIGPDYLGYELFVIQMECPEWSQYKADDHIGKAGG